MLGTTAAVLLALVLAATGGGAAPAAEELRPRQVRAATAASVRGFEALQRGDLARASELFERALAQVPNFPEARVGLGHVAYARRLYDAALSHYTAARDEIARLGAAARAAEQRAYDEALPRQLGYQDDINALEALPGADVQSQVRELERAIEEMKRYHPPPRTEVAPPPASLLYHRGNALFQLGRVDEAVADWQECARGDPEFGAVHNNLAVAYWKLGRLESARAELAEARRLGAKVVPDFERQLAAPDATAR